MFRDKTFSFSLTVRFLLVITRHCGKNLPRFKISWFVWDWKLRLILSSLCSLVFMGFNGTTNSQENFYMKEQWLSCIPLLILGCSPLLIQKRVPEIVFCELH